MYKENKGIAPSTMGYSIELLCEMHSRGYDVDGLLEYLLHNTEPESLAESLRYVYIELVEYTSADEDFNGSEYHRQHVYRIRQLCETIREMTA